MASSREEATKMTRTYLYEAANAVMTCKDIRPL